MNKNLNLISVDVETTGLHPKEDFVIEIGSIKTNIYGKRLGEFSELANPGIQLPKVITEVTNITDNMLKDKEHSFRVVEKWYNWLGDDPYILFAHNAPFDMRFIVRHLRESNINVEEQRAVDTLSWSKHKIHDSNNHKLGTLLEYIHFSQEGDLHRATFDSLGSLAIASYLLQIEKPKNEEEALNIFMTRSRRLKQWIGDF